VKESCINEVMKFVRCDGDSTAPVCFLTIEDGGEFWTTPDRTIENFRKAFQGNPVWVHSGDVSKMEKFGKPGQYMAKLMLSIFGGTVEQWQEYSPKLHKNNECNIKFYPIGGRRQTDWCPEFSDALGWTRNEYLEQCRAQRPEIIASTYPKAFNGKQFHIILGAKSEWCAFLKQFCYKGEVGVQQYKNDSGKLMYETYFEGGALVFAYFPIFRWGIKDQEIRDFGGLVGRHLREAVRRRVSVD